MSLTIDCKDSEDKTKKVSICQSCLLHITFFCQHFHCNVTESFPFFNFLIAEIISSDKKSVLACFLILIRRKTTLCGRNIFLIFPKLEQDSTLRAEPVSAHQRASYTAGVCNTMGLMWNLVESLQVSSDVTAGPVLAPRKTGETARTVIRANKLGSHHSPIHRMVLSSRLPHVFQLLPAPLPATHPLYPPSQVKGLGAQYTH